MTSIRYFFLVVLSTTCSGLFHLCSGDNVNHTIYIDPINGRDNISCIISNDPSAPCQSLKWALLPEHRLNSTQYVLREGKHFLNESIAVFEQLNQVTFTGVGAITTVIECTTSFIGFTFIDITSLKLTNLTFSGCSTLQNSTTRNFHKHSFVLYKFFVALYFYHCHDVTMSHIAISNTPNGMGVAMYDTDGTVEITDSIFTNNTVPVEEDQQTYPGGGGFYIEFSYCIPGDETCKDDRISYESRNRGAQYFFTRCAFSHNEANNFDNESAVSTFIIPHRSYHEAFGRGGGLSILINGNASDNIINISDCVFDSNQAVWGGGLFVEFHDDTANNTISVSNSTFTKNSCYYTADSGTGSGGMRMGYFVYDDVPGTSGNNVIVERCVFRENSALNGGGLSIVPVSQSTIPERVTKISIRNSVFENNVARHGSAISIDRFSLIQGGILPNVSIVNCNFTANSVEYVRNVSGYHNQPYQVGKGAVFIHQLKVSFEGEITFTQNSGTALAVVAAIVDFMDCSVMFDSNKGNNGGAVALMGSAHMLVNNQTNMTFIKNKAESLGGAIYNKYIEDENLPSYTIYTNCFIRHVDPYLAPEDWMSYFQFYENYDYSGSRKSSIHSTSIWPCAWAGGNGVSSNKSSIFCWERWIYWKQLYTERGSCTNEVNSDVGNITFTDTYSVNAFPGRPFTLPIHVLDDLHTDVSARTIFFGSTMSNDSSVGNVDQYGPFAYIWRESVIIRGAEERSVILQLNSLGERVWHVEIPVNLLSCPPGFKANIQSENYTNITTCVCARSYQQAVTCDRSTIEAFLKNDNWMGPPPSGHNETNYVCSLCPPGYCYTNPDSGTFLLPNSTEELDRLVCGSQNRTGILCGECIDGFGPAINTRKYHCINCTNQNIGENIAKYVASVYIPLGTLFTILILFDIRLTTGPANAFILYCQVVASTFDLDADGQVPLYLITSSSNILLHIPRYMYGIFNLEFVENFLPPLCLGTNLNVLSLLLMKYVVALSPILMIIVVTLCVKLTTCITLRCCRGENRLHQLYHTIRNRGGNGHSLTEAILPAFAAFLLLSYTKFSTVSTFLVNTQPLLKEDGSPILPPRVYYGGQYSSHDAEYRIRYLLPAILVFATFVAIPPLLLLHYPVKIFELCLSKINCLWRRYPVDKVHVFLDTFQGCYKDNMRFFPGLYFVFRLTINVAYIFSNTWLEQFAVQQIACVIMIMLLALCHPYKKNLFNYVDILIFTNLTVLNSLSFYLFSFSQINPVIQPPSSAFIVQYALVFLPLLYMISYIIWTLTQPWHRNVKHHLRHLLGIVAENAKIGNFRPLENVAINIGASTPILASSESEEEDETEAIFARAEDVNQYRPVNSVHLNRNEEGVIMRSSENSPLVAHARRGYGSHANAGPNKPRTM